MNIEEMRKILNAEGVRAAEYSLNEKDIAVTEISTFIRKTSHGYRVFATERNTEIYSDYAKNEDEACRLFLAWLAIGYPNLRKYLA